MAKHIFVTGGVVSSLGKGLTCASIGMLLALIYALASLTQVVVGHLIDKVSLKRLYLGMVLAQIPGRA